MCPQGRCLPAHTGDAQTHHPSQAVIVQSELADPDRAFKASVRSILGRREHVPAWRAIGISTSVRIGDATNFYPSPYLQAHDHRSTDAGPIDFSRYLQRQNEESAREPEIDRRVERPDAAPASPADDRVKSRYAPAAYSSSAKPSYAMPSIGDITPTKAEPVQLKAQPPVQHTVEQYHPIGTRVDVVV